MRKINKGLGFHGRLLIAFLLVCLIAPGQELNAQPANLSLAQAASSAGSDASAVISELEQQIQRLQQQGDAAAELPLQYQLAGLYSQQGDYAAAIAPYRRALALAEQLKANDQLPKILGNLTIAHRTLGQYRQAIEISQRNITLLEQQGSVLFHSIALGNLGNVYLDLGDYDLAEMSYEKGLALAEQVGDRQGQTILLNSLGALAAQRGQSRQASRFYERSLAMAEQDNDQLGQGASWLNLGDVARQRGKLAEAIAAYEKSLVAARAVKNRPLEATALGSLGTAHGQRRAFDQEQAYLQQSLDIAEQLGDRRLIALTLNNLGHSHHNARQYAPAEAALRRALTVLDDLRKGLSDLDKVSIFDTQTKTYNLLQQVLSTQSRSADALEVAEWGRARAFADLLNQRLDNNADGSDASATIEPPRIAELQRIARDRNATLVEYTLVPEDNFLHQGKQMGIPEAIYIWVVQPDGKVHQRRADLKPLIAQKQPLELLVRASRCFESASLCKRQLQRQMRERAAEDSRGFSFNAPEPEPVVEASDASPAARSYAGLQQLHQLLIEPIAELLPDDPEQQVIVIPQGELFLVPFPALQDPTGEFLIARHTLLTAPSIQTLALTERAKAQLPKHSKTAQDVLVVGNPTMPSVSFRPNQPATPLAPLPGSEGEAIAIAKLLKTQPLLGAQATESVVLQRLSKARWVHLATHGLLSYGANQPGPRGSRQREVPGAMALATDPAGTSTVGLGADNIRLDGLLTSTEIINLRLNAELVVLSACDTGRGDLTGDGVVGLARAWMGAGVPSVVVSLWAVSDESTAALMQAFYGNLAQGMGKAQALRQAMLTTSQTYSNPSDWSAFTLLGEAE